MKRWILIAIWVVGLITVIPVFSYLLVSIGQPLGSLDDLSRYGSFIGGTIGTFVIALSAYIIYQNLIHFKSSNELLSSSIELQQKLISQERKLLTIKSISNKYDKETAQYFGKMITQKHIRISAGTTFGYSLTDLLKDDSVLRKVTSVENVIRSAVEHDKITFLNVIGTFKKVSEDLILFMDAGGSLRHLALPSSDILECLKIFHDNHDKLRFLDDLPIYKGLTSDFKIYYQRLNTFAQEDENNMKRALGLIS